MTSPDPNRNRQHRRRRRQLLAQPQQPNLNPPTNGRIHSRSVIWREEEASPRLIHKIQIRKAAAAATKQSAKALFRFPDYTIP